MASIVGSDVHKVVLACEAGMGSSALVVSQLKRQLAGLPVEVVHTAVGRIPDDADVILCHRSLSNQARMAAPGHVVIPFDTFIGDPVFKRVVDALRNGTALEG
jgi:mannitol-specific phosphotransferase system IIBC component